MKEALDAVGLILNLFLIFVMGSSILSVMDDAESFEASFVIGFLYFIVPLSLSRIIMYFVLRRKIAYSDAEQLSCYVMIPLTALCILLILFSLINN